MEKAESTFIPTEQSLIIRKSSLGIDAVNTYDLIQIIADGFSFKALCTFETFSGLSIQLLAPVIGIPDRTLARRRAAGKLASGESERLLRIAMLYEKSLELFEGDRQAAANWLSSPKKDLGNETPLQYAKTEIGAREVEDLLGRIEDGVFS